MQSHISRHLALCAKYSKPWNTTKPRNLASTNPLPAWVPFPVAKFAVKRLAALTKAWYAWERKCGGGGTCRGDAPLYASVEKLLAEQKK